MKTKLVLIALILGSLVGGVYTVRAFSTTPNQIAVFDGSGNPSDSIINQANGRIVTVNGTATDEVSCQIVAQGNNPDGYAQIISANDTNKYLAFWQAGSTDSFHGNQGVMYTNQLHIFSDASIGGGDGSISFYTEPTPGWVNIPRFKMLTNGVFNLGNSNGAITINGTQVVSSRKTGWTAATGTADRSTFNTDTATLQDLARRVKALEDDLIAHGLIGQ